jgi:hypothetical protein
LSAGHRINQGGGPAPRQSSRGRRQALEGEGEDGTIQPEAMAEFEFSRGWHLVLFINLASRTRTTNLY